MDYEFETNSKDEFIEDNDEKISDNSDNDSESVKDINEVEQALSENESESDEESDEESEDEETINLPPKTYIPDGSKTEDLIVDESAYILLCKSKTSYPCMSFDIILDNLGEGEDRSNSFPVSMSLVGGTYSGKKNTDSLILMKFSKLNQGSKNSKPENLITEINNKDKQGATLRYVKIPHKGCVNRLKCKNLNGETYCSTWSENGNIYIWNLNKPLKAISNDKLMNNFNSKSVEPVFIFKEHNQDGFAMDWSSISEGYLATGDMNGKIFLMKPGNSNEWIVNNQPLLGHSNSVEDIQWSPTEQSILASCSSDRSIRIWDIRNENSSMIKINEAHNKDVNVISWNKLDHPFLLSGGDDGLIKVWDLRMLQSSSKPSPIATFSHHTKPITSLEWNPNDSSSFIASSEDDQLTIWDLSVERDVETNLFNEENEELKKLPPQLLFIHQGQKEIKEIHWHNQLPGYIISTSLTGFDIFRTISF